MTKRGDAVESHPALMPSAGLVVGVAASASRLLGFARDILMAGALGAGPVADAFLTALRLPNLVRRVLGEGGLNAGFVPLYLKTKQRSGETAADLFAARAFSSVGFGLLVLTAIVELGAGAILPVLSYGQDSAFQALAVFYTRLSFPFVMGVTLASLAAAILNAQNRFNIAAFAPLVVNGLLVLVLLAQNRFDLDLETKATILALAVMLTGFLQLGIVWMALPNRSWERPRYSSDIRRLVKIGFPAFLASGAAQVMLATGLIAASFIPSGLSWLYYADRLFQLPLGFIGAASGIVLLPRMAAYEASGDPAPISSALNHAFAAAMALALPAAAALMILAFPIVFVLFERDAFSRADTQGAAAALIGFAPGLPFAAMGKIGAQACFARHDFKTALWAGGFGIAATLLACALLVVPWGILGIGLGTSLGLAVHAVTLSLALRRKNLWRIDRRTLSLFARTLLATALMSLALVVIWGWIRLFLVDTTSTSLKILILTILCVGGLSVYAGAGWALGLAELKGEGRPAKDKMPLA